MSDDAAPAPPDTPLTIEAAKDAVGRRVVYDDGHGTRETGVITSVSALCVFVRYGDHPNAQATSPEDLRFEIGGAA